MLLFLIFLVFLALNGVFRAEKLLVSAKDACFSNWHCDYEEICCRGELNIHHGDNAVKRCRNRTITVGERSCFGHYCTSHDDCQGKRGVEKLCCLSNKCELCPTCYNEHDCSPYHNVSLHHCCKKTWSTLYGKYCRQSCIGEHCNYNSDCAGECCRRWQCTNCSNPGCRYRQECQPGECCVGHQCVECSTCDDNIDCKPGMYCCENFLPENTCNHSCVGNPCSFDHDCGAPDECCVNNVCVKCGDHCKSNTDCFNGAYCCRGVSFEDSKCTTDCYKKLCFNDTDCGEPGTFCDDGECSYDKACHSNSDCVTSDGRQYYCCYYDYPYTIRPRVCQQDCLNLKCSSDEHCPGPNECCGWGNECTTMPCSKGFPKWLTGVIVGCSLSVIIVGFAFCWCCRRKRICRRTAHPSSDQSERQSPRNSPNRPSQLLCREQINLRSACLANDEAVGVELRSSYAPPPSYSLLDPIFHSSNNEILSSDQLNLPPPPYSFDDQLVSTAVNDDLPPRYEA